MKHVILIKAKSLLLTAAILAVCLICLCVLTRRMSDDGKTALQEQSAGYVILAANDLGMHCYQDDYSGFMILPPGNNLKVQVFRREGDEAKLIRSGIEVSYRILDNTTSADKINFWDYAAAYGYNLAPNIGITGSGLSGRMVLSEDGRYYEATGIPVTPYNDGSTKLNPYQLASVTVLDSATGRVLASTDAAVVPVSDEMDCENCHGKTDTDKNILGAHDERSGTQLLTDLQNGVLHRCSECHQDNILNAPGSPGVPPLSQAMHSFHADKTARSTVQPACYNCHPGPVTQCYRGIMYAEGVSCVSSECHGDMAQIAKTQAEGRQAWLQEPDCGSCHGAQYGVNAGQLYRNSYLINNLSNEMNGIILCQSCHNSTHAEWKSSLPLDNQLPTQLLGYPSYIDRCTVCHEAAGMIHNKQLN